MKLQNLKSSLSEKLAAYGEGEVLPMHMPGHKRKAECVDARIPWNMDITEIDGFDDLHDAHGILAEIQNAAADLYNAQVSRVLVGGSTCGILAAVGACTRRGAKIIMARNCHKSVYHAAELFDLKPEYILPQYSEDYPFCGSISPESVKLALQEHPDAECLIITSPTYEGVISDVKSIAQICHSKNIPFIVDEAHGAHLGLWKKTPESAVSCGADAVIQSLHKTLPALTGCALLHKNGELVSTIKIDHMLDMVETSSPSYLLMASADSCLRYMKKDGMQAGLLYEQALYGLEARVKDLKHIQLMRPRESTDFCFAYDAGKLVITCKDALCGGPVLMKVLREQYAIEAEMCCSRYVLAMTSVMDNEESLGRLAEALIQLDIELEKLSVNSMEKPDAHPYLSLPQKQMEPCQAMECEACEIEVDKAEGRVSAGYVMAYPPGIPVLVPGEVIGSHAIAAIREMHGKGIALRSTGGDGSHTILVINNGKKIQ